jgi:hypothetical protein
MSKRGSCLRGPLSWTIEIVFRWLKRVLHLDTLISYSRGGDGEVGGQEAKLRVRAEACSRLCPARYRLLERPPTGQ